MLVEAVQAAPHAPSSLKLDENDLVQALFENLGSDLRHAMFNRERCVAQGGYSFKDCRAAFSKDMAAKVILKERESKPLIDELKKIDGYQQLSHKSRVELQPVKNADVVSVDGAPVALRKNGELIPTLVNNEAITTLPKVVVDMGAVPHVVGGADIMAPGIRKVQGVFSAGQLVVVVDEKYGKSLAVGRALQDSSSFSKISKGKVIQNLHYVGDPAWELIKTFAKSLQLGT